jgi:acetyl esterase/lipase
MRLRLCVFEAAIDATQRRDGSVNRFLFSLFDRRAPADPRPDAAGVSSTDITVDASRGLWARVFYSPLPSPRPVVVYFHGGGFTLFSAASRAYDALCRTLCVAAAAAVVVSVDYRLAPEHRAPLPRRHRPPRPRRPGRRLHLLRRRRQRRRQHRAPRGPAMDGHGDDDDDDDR